MLKGVTNTFITNCNARELTYREYIVIDNEQIPVRAKLTDDCYENGNFIGSFILKTIQFETSNDISYRNKEFEYYKVVNNESIKIGTFITTEIQNDDTTEIVKVTGMDYGLKTQVEYTSSLNYGSGTVTLKDVWDECCQLSGIESGVNSFENSDFIVDSDQFTGTGATIRDVFKGIAMSSGSFIKVMNDDKIYPVFNEQTTDIIEDYVDLEDKRDTHPWTCLRLGMSQIDGENVDIIDEELVEEYGENWLILNDNPFAYNQEKRQQLITAIFNKVKGFGYSAFVSKTSFKPYLTCGDVIKFRNKNGDLVNSILLRYSHDYKENDMNIQLEAPSETTATVNYVYPLSAIEISKRTQVEVDKEKVQITNLTEQTSNIQDELGRNYYTKEESNILVQTAQTGLTNTFSEAGGNNIFRNTGLFFENNGQDRATNPYEFWYGLVKRTSETKASNRNALLLQEGTLYQEQVVPNGNYTISFKYKKVIALSNLKVSINGEEIALEQVNDTEFIKTIEVTSQSINVSFYTDVDDGCEIYDLMVNAGSVRLAYSQNQNETTTDTVNISKGIEVTSSETKTRFRADSDGVRIYDLNSSSSDAVTNFTDKGMETKEATITKKATITKVLFQEVGSHTWITRL